MNVLCFMMNYWKTAKFFLFLPPLGMALVTPSVLFPFIVGKYVWFRGSVSFALIAFSLGMLFQDQNGEMLKRLKDFFRRPLVIAVSAFAFFFALASLFAFDPAIAFWSNFERGEGGLQILNLFVYFSLLLVLFRDAKDWRRLFVCAIIGGILSIFYGLLAGMGSDGFIGPLFSESGFRFQASIGNPAYVAIYAIFLSFFALYLFVSSRFSIRSLRRVLLAFLIVAFILMFYFAATRGAFVGLIGMFLAFLGYVMLSRKALRKWFLVAASIVIFLVFLGVQFHNTEFVRSLPGSRILDLSFTARTFEDRTIMWNIAWEGFKARPLLGWGPENYIQVFDRHFDIRYFRSSQNFGAWFDRAHSIYFDYLVEIGILGLLSFLSIFAVFYFEFFRATRTRNRETKDKQETGSVSVSRRDLIVRGLLFSLPFAYLIQGLVLFDVFTIYLNVFIFLSFSSYLFYFAKQSL